MFFKHNKIGGFTHNVSGKLNSKHSFLISQKRHFCVAALYSLRDCVHGLKSSISRLFCCVRYSSFFNRSAIAEQFSLPYEPEDYNKISNISICAAGTFSPECIFCDCFLTSRRTTHFRRNNGAFFFLSSSSFKFLTLKFSRSSCITQINGQTKENFPVWPVCILNIFYPLYIVKW